MEPSADGAAPGAAPDLPPTVEELRRAAFMASELRVALFEAIQDDTGAVVDFSAVTPREPAGVAAAEAVPADDPDSLRLTGPDGLLPAVREQVLDSWRSVLATGVPTAQLVWVPSTEGRAAGSWFLRAFRAGTRLGVAGRRQETGPDARTATPDRLLANSLLAAGVSSWEWDPDDDELRWISTPPGLLGLTTGVSTLRLRDFLAYVHPDDRAALERSMRASLDTRAAFRAQFRVGSPTYPAPARPGRTAPPGGNAGDAGIPAGEAVGGRTRILAGKPPPPADLDSEDGSLILRMAGNATIEGGRRRVAGVLEDVTDATRARQALTQNQRLASLGQLAAGIAHDFNNVLTVVTMRADMLRGAAAEATDGAPSEEDAVAILEAASRASALTRQLMLFAGHQGGRSAEIEVGEIVSALRPLVDAMREDIFTTAYEIGDCPPVRTERVQIEQIVVNLALNARDALREVPRPTDRALVLSVRVRALPGDSPELGDRTPVPHPADRVDAAPGGPPAGVSWIVLEVADTGVGMDPATQSRSLDPFFTTKPVGVGTGLGLSVVHGLVEQMGGWMLVQSEPGAGTTVRVVLPGTRPVGGPPVDARPQRPVGTRSRLVVVDDDDAVRSVTSRSLTMHGFEVLQAHNAEEALAALAEETDIVALVSDIVMPGMSGTDLAARVLEDYPAVPVLLVTGYTPPTDVISNPRLSLVTKPLTGARLAQSLNELLTRVEEAAAEGGTTAT